MTVNLDHPGFYVSDTAWPEVQATLEDGIWSILPVGAAAKEHGFHLPLNTDYLQVKWLVERLMETVRVAVWPVVSYGYYPAFVDYPGSCSLSRNTFEVMTEEIISNIVRSGGRQILIINAGVSTVGPINSAIKRCPTPRHVKLANIYEGAHYKAAAQQVTQQIRGGHADEAETSILLACAPHAVQIDRVTVCTRPMANGPLNRTNPMRPNYSPSGVYGDPSLATRDKGEALLNAILQDLYELLL